MITVTLTFNTAEEALAALKRLEGTAADPANKAGKSVTEKPATIPPTAAQAAAPETKAASSGKPLDFKADLVPPFLALATTEGGPDKQRKVLEEFGIAKLSALGPEQYAEALKVIRGLS